MIECITIPEDIYRNSDEFVKLYGTHDIDLEVVADHCVDGVWLLEVEVTGDNTGIFIQLYDALFN